MEKKRIAVLVSGGGTNLQALIDAEQKGDLHSGEIAVVISSKPGAYALERAEKAGIPGTVVDRKAFSDKESFEKALLSAIESYRIDYLVLAGFMLVLSPEFIQKFPDRIVNVHPSLIPAFCGDGFYGLKVHEEALSYGVKVTGATVHFVNEITDGGAIILQRAVEIPEGISPSDLQQKVMKEAEHILLPKAVELLCAGKVCREGRRVIIKE